MACISLGFIENILIWLVVLGAILALVNLLLPLVLGPLGGAGATIVAALRIVVWAIVCIFVIIVVFDLASCLLGSVHVHG
jgi:hypothetical protein